MHKAVDEMANEKWMAYMTMRTPMRRLAKPEDVDLEAYNKELEKVGLKFDLKKE